MENRREIGCFLERNTNHKKAIDTEKYLYTTTVNKSVREELGLLGKIVIGHVGNFTPAKNHIFLLEIFKEILKNHQIQSYFWSVEVMDLLPLKKRQKVWELQTMLFLQEFVPMLID